MTIKVKPLRDRIAEICSEDDDFVGIGADAYDKADRILSAIEAVDPATIRAEALRDMIAAKAREYADHYPQSSDGRNTFLMFAEWVEALALIDKEKDQ